MKNQNNIVIVAELGINHNGSIEIARALIDKAAQAGCDAIKLQKRTIELVYSKKQLQQKRESPWGKTFGEQKRALEFSIKQYVYLQGYARRKGLMFIVSCWDVNSVKQIEKYCKVDYHKVASPMLTDNLLLKAINNTGKPVILSTGMSTPEQIGNALHKLSNLQYILACTSTYPTEPQEVNLNYISTLKDTYENKYKIGFSNHSSTQLACLSAAALSADMIEFHITLDRSMQGSDQAASIDHVKQLVDGIRRIEIMSGDGIKRVYESERQIMNKLRRIK